MTSRSDILAEFAMEEIMDHSVLKVYITRHPELANDLLDLFAECTIVDLEAEDANSELETKWADSIISNSQAVEIALYGEGVRELASKIGLPRSFLIGLNAGFVQLGSIPGPLIKNIAQSIGAKTQEVLMAMQTSGNKNYAFKADQKPQSLETVTFENYVNRANLSIEEEAALSRLTDTDGPH